MENIKSYNAYKNGFKFRTFVNKEKRVVVVKLIEMPVTHVNISIGALKFNEIDENAKKKLTLKPTNAMIISNVVKVVNIPVFNQTPPVIAIAKCNPCDEWNENVGREIALNRAYKQSYKLLKDAIIKSIG